MRKRFCLGALAALATMLAAAPTAGAAGETPCVGALPPGTYEDIVVPPQAFCELQDSQVHGNVLVHRQAFLDGLANTISGDVRGVENQGHISLHNGNRVLGDVSALDDASISLSGDNTVLGNVEVRERSSLEASDNGLAGIGPEGGPQGLRGNIKAGRDSILEVVDSRVGGSVEGDKARVVQVVDFGGLSGATVIGKNIIAKEGTGGEVRVCGTVVDDGNIQVEKFSDSSVYIGEDTFCTGFGGGNTLAKGDIRAAENLIAPLQMLGIEQNSVPQGNLQVFKNTGAGAKTVQFNTVGKALECFENTPPFVGTPNTAGERKGQCAP